MSGLQRYEILLELPLFQGMSQSDLSAVVGQTKFSFHKYSADSPIISEHDACDRLYFLLTGALRVVAVADDHGYRLQETLPAPAILQPSLLFGWHQRFTRTFIAETPCQLMSVEKNEILRLAEDFMIFRLNLFNTLCTQEQRLSRQLWLSPPSSLAARICRFIQSRCLYSKGSKELYIKMTRLASELNDSRLNISIALNELQQQGLLSLHRGRITISHVEKLDHR